MASADQIAELRRAVNEPGDETYSDDYLSARLDDTGGNVAAAAAGIWREKAATYADLADVREGSSQRSLGDLHEQALSMASLYDSRTPGASGARTRAITRP